MNKYIYKTTTGNVAIQLDAYWCDMLNSADHDEFNQNRCHIRNDHKYAPGEPIQLGESVEDWLVFSMDKSYKAVELKIDLEMALKTLTLLQRKYFTLNRIWGYSYAEIAGFDGKSKMTICEIVITAEKKIRSFMK